MALRLSPKNQARITEMVEHGDYPDADTMMELALKLLAERDIKLKAMSVVGVEEVAVDKGGECTPERREAL